MAADRSPKGLVSHIISFFERILPTCVLRLLLPSNTVSFDTVVRTKAICRQMRLAVRQPATFANAEKIVAISDDIAALLRNMSSLHFVFGMQRLVARLAFATESCVAYQVTACSSESVRTALENELLVAIPTLVPTITIGGSHRHDDRVLCVCSQSVFTVAPGFYFESCALSVSHLVSVVNIPRWLHQASQILRTSDTFLAATGPASRVYRVASHALAPACVEIPTPDVLDSVLKLWSPVKGDLYHDLGAAVAAASRLT